MDTGREPRAEPPLPLLSLTATLALRRSPFPASLHLPFHPAVINLRAGDVERWKLLSREIYHGLDSGIQESWETGSGAIAGPDGLCEAAKRTGCLLGVVYTRGYRSAAAESGLWPGVQRLDLCGLEASPGGRGSGHLGGHGGSGSETISCGSRRDLKKTVVQGPHGSGV